MTYKTTLLNNVNRHDYHRSILFERKHIHFIHYEITFKSTILPVAQLDNLLKAL